MLPEQFRQTASAITQLLNNWWRYGLDLEDIERDLLLLGFGAEHVRVFSSLLARLSPIKEQVWLWGIEVVQRVVGLPAVDDVNIVWNARPLFGGPAYYYYTVDGDDPYTKFVGLTYLATLEIITSDNYGQKQRTAIQLTEEGFKSFLVGMRRASEQLDILKERTKTVVPDAARS